VAHYLTIAGVAAILRYAYEFEEAESASIWSDNGHEVYRYSTDAPGADKH
jgi:hypothetical protein